jgi:hypothetical protein
MRESLKAPQMRGVEEPLLCEGLAQLRVELRKAKERLRHKRDLILGCIRQPGFEL